MERERLTRDIYTAYYEKGGLNMNRTWKQIELSRERRLWITQVVMPIVALTATVAVAKPEVFENVKAKANKVVENIKTKFHK